MPLPELLLICFRSQFTLEREAFIMGIFEERNIINHDILRYKCYYILQPY